MKTIGEKLAAKPAIQGIVFSQTPYRERLDKKSAFPISFTKKRLQEIIEGSMQSAEGANSYLNAKSSHFQRASERPRALVLVKNNNETPGKLDNMNQFPVLERGSWKKYGREEKSPVTNISRGEVINRRPSAIRTIIFKKTGGLGDRSAVDLKRKERIQSDSIMVESLLLNGAGQSSLDRRIGHRLQSLPKLPNANRSRPEYYDITQRIYDKSSNFGKK